MATLGSGLPPPDIDPLSPTVAEREAPPPSSRRDSPLPASLPPSARPGRITPEPPSWEEPPPSVRASPLARLGARIRSAVLDEDPRFLSALALALIAAAVLFARSPSAPYTGTERSVLAGSPYVNREAGLRFADAVHLDIGGLGTDKSFGSYGPIALMLWRISWSVSTATPVNRFLPIVLHAMNAALLVLVAFGITRRRGLAWAVGAVFVTAAITAGTVASAAGLADILVGTGLLLALLALRLPAWAMPFGVAAGALFSLFSKESGIVCLPILAFAALVTGRVSHPKRPASVARGMIALAAAGTALTLYMRLRAAWFPWPADRLAGELAYGSPLRRWVRVGWLWFHDTGLRDAPYDAALALTDRAHRVAGGLRLYWRGISQVVLPKGLVDRPDCLFGFLPPRAGWESYAGAAVVAFAVVGAVLVWGVVALREARARSLAASLDPDAADLEVEGVKPIGRRIGVGLLALIVVFFVVDEIWLRPRGLLRGWNALPLWVRSVALAAPALVAAGMIVEGGKERAAADDPDGQAPASVVPALAIGLFAMVVGYFPHANVAVVLGLSHAERFWYVPAIATSLCLGSLFAMLLERGERGWASGLVAVLFGGFIAMQCVQAYRYTRRYPEISLATLERGAPGFHASSTRTRA